MSEKINTPEALPTPEEHELLTAKASPEKPAQAEKDPKLAAHEARSTIAETTGAENQPNPLEKLEAAENAPQPVQPAQVNRELKQITLRRELQAIRRKLPLPQRTLSRVIHQPVVRAVSEAAGKTISRPSGLLGGGIVALAGTSAYLYIAKHVGFQYNYGVFLLLFGGGFVFGVLLELLVHMAMSGRRSERD